VTREDRIRNDHVRNSVGVASVVDKMKENRLRWCGHKMRRDKTEVVRVVMKIYVEGRRRPKKIWLYTIESHMRAAGMCV